MVSPGAVLQVRDAGPSNSIRSYRNQLIQLCSDAIEPELASFAVDGGAGSLCGIIVRSDKSAAP